MRKIIRDFVAGHEAFLDLIEREASLLQVGDSLIICGPRTVDVSNEASDRFQRMGRILNVEIQSENHPTDCDRTIFQVFKI